MFLEESKSLRTQIELFIDYLILNFVIKYIKLSESMIESLVNLLSIYNHNIIVSMMHSSPETTELISIFK